MAVVAVIGGIALIVLCALYPIVRVSFMVLLSVAKIIVACYITEFDDYFIAYSIMTGILILFVLGKDIFNSYTKGNKIFEFFPDRTEVHEDGNHPIQGFIGTVVACAMLMGIEYLLGLLFASYNYLIFVSAIVTILAVIQLIMVVYDEYF